MYTKGGGGERKVRQRSCVRLWMEEKKGFKSREGDAQMHLLTIVVITNIIASEMRDGLEEAL
jgi:hypothetical protein